MAMGHDNNDGSDTFWPGYVDAVTNLVLNLLFLLTIMIVAVFMFALELGRSSKGGADKTLNASSKRGDIAAPKPATDPVKENIELKREIERLNKLLAQRTPQSIQPGSLAKTVDVTSALPKPQHGLEKTLGSESEIMVRFMDEAVAFTPVERERLLESLKPFAAAGKAAVVVDVPSGFSEARRMGYYRAMAVRNLLIEMKIPKERIDVAVRESKSNANASIVRVRPR